jgi:hypothetical protein
MAVGYCPSCIQVCLQQATWSPIREGCIQDRICPEGRVPKNPEVYRKGAVPGEVARGQRRIPERRSSV